MPTAPVPAAALPPARCQALLAAVRALGADPDGQAWRRSWHPGADLTQPGGERILEALVEAAVGVGPTAAQPTACWIAQRALRSPLRNGTRLTRRAVLLAYEFDRRDGLLDALLRQTHHGLDLTERALLVSQAGLVRIARVQGGENGYWAGPDQPGEVIPEERRERLLATLVRWGLPTTLSLSGQVLRAARQGLPEMGPTLDDDGRPQWFSARSPSLRMGAPRDQVEVHHTTDGTLERVEWALADLWHSPFDPSATGYVHTVVLKHRHTFNARVEQDVLRRAIDEAVAQDPSEPVVLPAAPPRRRL